MSDQKFFPDSSQLSKKTVLTTNIFHEITVIPLQSILKTLNQTLNNPSFKNPNSAFNKNGFNLLRNTLSRIENQLNNTPDSTVNNKLF